MKTDPTIKRTGVDFRVLRALILFPVCLLCALPGISIIYFGYPNKWFFYVGFLIAFAGLLYGPLLLLGKQWSPQYPMKRMLRGQSLAVPRNAEQTDAANRHPFGTSGMAPADPASRAGAMPEASGDS